MPDERSPGSGKRSRDRSVPEPTYTLDELCTLGGVSVRTVRYYISEGLLPPPIGHGTYARYTQDHLDRLLVISALKERYLPLREIRRSLDALSNRDIHETADLIRQSNEANDDGVEPLHGGATQSAALQAPDVRHEAARRGGATMVVQHPSSAAGYIADVLGQNDRLRPVRVGRAKHGPPVAEPDATAWRRVPIADGAELLVSEEIWQRRREPIESLVVWAKRILSGT